MITRLSKYLSKLAFSSRLLYAGMFAKLWGRCQPPEAKISYTFGSWRLSPPLWREAERATNSGWPDYRIPNIHRPLAFLYEPVFLSPTPTRYSIVRTIAGGGNYSLLLESWNIGISFLLPLLRVLWSMFSSKCV